MTKFQIVEQKLIFAYILMATAFIGVVYLDYKIALADKTRVLTYVAGVVTIWVAARMAICHSKKA